MINELTHIVVEWIPVLILVGFFSMAFSVFLAIYNNIGGKPNEKNKGKNKTHQGRNKEI